MSGSLQRILYVEDDPDIQMIASLALETLGGFELRICSSGEQALAEAAGFAPDLLLLDVMMPGLDGPQTLEALRHQPGLAATPAIFMTAKVQTEEVDEYRRLGALGVIPKPFDPMTLAERVRQLWQAPTHSDTQ